MPSQTALIPLTRIPNPRAAACAIWKTAMRGVPPGGRIGKAVNELMALGVEPAELLSTWEYYLQNENARFVSPQSFALK